jgi:hypothetical protein
MMASDSRLVPSDFPSISIFKEFRLPVDATIVKRLRVGRMKIEVHPSREAAGQAAIVRRTIEEAVSTACPSTILRTHPDVTVFLDQDSAGLIEPGSGD